MNKTKQDLRRFILQQRKALSLDDYRHHSNAIITKIMNSAEFKASESIAAYLPIHNEVDLTALFHEIKLLNKKVYLPVIKKNESPNIAISRSSQLVSMSFHLFSSFKALLPNQWQILEPSAIFDTQINPEDLDIVYMPLVAFDHQGHRLGMGKGFYDRYFHFKKKAIKPLLVGVAYEFQHVENIPAESWDISLDAVITEQKSYWF